MQATYCAACRTDLPFEDENGSRLRRCPACGTKLFITGEPDPEEPERFWCAKCRAERQRDDLTESGRCTECHSRVFGLGDDRASQRMP